MGGTGQGADPEVNPEWNERLQEQRKAEENLLDRSEPLKPTLVIRDYASAALR